MTMQNEQISEQEVADIPDIQGMPDFDIVDVTDAQVDIQDAPPPPPAAQEPVTAPPETPAPLPERDPQLDVLAQQNNALQQQLSQWNQWQQQQQMERQILEEANAARQQLEQQGYPEDQIEVIVSQQQSFQRREAELQAQLQKTQLHEQGRYRAAMHYAKQHGVDADTLLPYNTPQEMESRAREMSRISQLEAKLAKYEKAQVPAQNFDSGTSAVSAASSEETWLERYNAGDRSEQAAAAARRAAGLG
jgi:hypothetical protein